MKLLRTALIAVAAGFLFNQIGMFLPWLLGPMFTLLLLRQFTAIEFYWPRMFRTIGLILLGIMIGASFTREAVLLMWVDLPYMLFMTVSVIIAALLFGLLFKKMANESLETSLLGSMPGGLSQMVLISEEVINANVTVVSVMQTFRIFLVVTIVPLLTTLFVGREATTIAAGTEFSFSPQAFVIAVSLGVLAYLLMKKLHFPAKELLAPVLVMAIVQSVTGDTLIEMPELLVILAQLLVGAHLGLQMEKLRENMSIRLAFAIFVNNVLLIAFTVLIAYILSAMLPEYLFLDFFLSAAPGGMAEMGITALAAGADVALITSFHLFRLFFILLLAAPLVAYVLKKLDAKSGN